MKRIVLASLLLLPFAALYGQQSSDPVDLNKARQLLERRQSGETLSSEERAYLQRATAARSAGPGGGTRLANQRQPTERLTPLTDMPAGDRYEGEDGGLYGAGRNAPPDGHRQAAEAELAKIRPLNADGEPDESGVIGFVAISMSNATQEFSRFKQLADRSPLKSPHVVIVDCAQGGQAMAEWAPADARPWEEARRRLAAAQLSLRQVQMAWIKLANKGPTGSLQEHGRRLERDTLAVLHNAKTQFPNLRIVYLGSRTYGGYATGGLNPEPYAYESAFAARWLIQRQVQGDAALALTKSPLLLWGPYFWAEGTKGRKVDSLAWERTDFGADGVHPSDSGRQKVAELLLRFFTTDPLARSWFSGPRAGAIQPTSASGVAGAASLETQPPVVLRGERVMVEAAVKDGRLQERYLAFRDGAWLEVATTDPGQALGPVSVVNAERTPLVGTVLNVSLSGGALVEEFAAGEHRIIRKLNLVGNGPWVRIATRFEPAGRVSLRQLADHFKFSQRPDWSFSPSVGGFNPDAQYKAPLILVQADRTALGIVPDVATLRREDLKRCPHALDLDVPGGPILGVGFMPARMAWHSVYALDTNRTWTAETAIENACYLLVTASAAPGQAYREAVRFHWERFGRDEQARAADQQVGTDARYRSLALWDEWREVVWKEESPQMWLAVPLADGSTGGGVRTKRWGPGPSVYLSSWFNTLRTSYGMALYARRTGNTNLLALARQTVEVALKAPGGGGAFKCIAVPQEGGTIWAAGDGSGGSTKDGFLGYDMCWTAYWLLKWRAAELPGSQHILPRCRELARFMMARQRADGLLPTRMAEDGAVQEELSRTVKAETGPVVFFLLALYDQDRNPKYLEAARKGLDFLEQEVIPTRQWYDYETFWSCSPRKAQLDERTQQWPANNLALTQAVEAYLLAYRITGESRYLSVGEVLLDYLLLYQQCWTHPGLQNLSSSAMLLGGFTTQNSDAEWSDARQSQCGNVLLDYYRTTGRIEYLERGIAALRAQFPVSPSENWAHSGYGAKAGASSYHWGTGSGMAGIELEEDFLHDAIVDVAAGRGIGVNGLNLTACAVSDGQIRFQLSSPFAWKRAPVVVFRHTEPLRRYRLQVNGAEAGTWRGEDLEKGISLALEKGH